MVTKWLFNQKTGNAFTLIDSNRMRREAMDMKAKHYHEGILANEMLAQSEYIKKHVMNASGPKTSTSI